MFVWSPALVLSYNPEVLALADEIGKTPDVSAAHTQACTAGSAQACMHNATEGQRSICALCSLVVQDELLAKALAVTAAASEAAAASKGAGAGAGASAGGAARKGRPALNIGAVKNANATPEAAQADEQESQADALLKAKRMRNLKRQSLPEKLPASVQDQMPQ